MFPGQGRPIIDLNPAGEASLCYGIRNAYMSGTTRIESTDKPNFCPTCGRAAVVEIAYGLPNPSAFEDAAAGSVVLGGCCLSSDNPDWQCTSCEQQIHRIQDAEDDPD